MANPSAYKLSFVLCKSTGEQVGEPINAGMRKLSRRRNVPGIATLVVPLESESAMAIVPGASRLKIYRSATPAELALNPAAPKVLVAYYSLPAENVLDDVDTNACTAIFWDPRWVLAKRQLQAAAAYAATDQGSILWTTVANENARQDTWLRQGATITGVIRDRTYDAGKEVGQLVDEMTKITNGPDVDVTAIDGYATFGDRRMGTFNVFARQGIDRPNAVYYTTREHQGSGGGGNIVGIKRTYQPIINGSTQQGTAPDGTASAQRFALATGYDLLETYETASDAYTAAGLLEKAQGVVAQGSNLRQVLVAGRAVGDAPLPLADYDLGDTVRLSVRIGRVAFDRAVMRIEGYDLQPDQEGNVQATPIFADA